MKVLEKAIKRFCKVIGFKKVKVSMSCYISEDTNYKKPIYNMVYTAKVFYSKITSKKYAGKMMTRLVGFNDLYNAINEKFMDGEKNEKCG